MTELHALALEDAVASDDVTTIEEVRFDAPGDLGISVAVDADGAVVVTKLLQLRGYAELSCPTLHAGDVLVAIDHQPVTEWSFTETMQRLRASVDSRPTRLEFLAVGRFDSADSAVAKWTQRQRFAGAVTSGRDDDPRLREGEFDVAFAPHQPTGLRFSESYIMTTPLKLAHMETALFTAMGLRGRSLRVASRDALLNTILVRVGDDSVLGAPVDDVMALLYDAESFPKTLWLAQPQRLQQDYQVVTLATRDQLKWFCFVPVETMMEVAVVSYAALATSDSHVPDVATSAATRQRTRSDGICEHQYLMAINGFPTLRMSSESNFRDDENEPSLASSSDEDGIVAIVNTSLDALLGLERTLRFRDLKAYRREFLAHAPLSPWQRRRRPRDPRTPQASRMPLAVASPVANASADRVHATVTTQLLSSPATPGNERHVQITHKPQRFFQILKDHHHSDEDDTAETMASPAKPGEFQRPVIKRYRGLANCEGVRSFTPIAGDDVKCVIVPDNRRPVGMQLETDVTPTGRPVFKAFVRSDGPALASQHVQVGDRLLSVNGVSVDEISSDLLLRILHGEDAHFHDRAEPTTLSTPATTRASSDSRLRSLSNSNRSRVLRFERRCDARRVLHGGSVLDHAKKLLALSSARLALWRSSQTRRSSLVS